MVLFRHRLVNDWISRLPFLGHRFKTRQAVCCFQRFVHFVCVGHGKILQGNTASQQSAVWVRQLRKDGAGKDKG